MASFLASVAQELETLQYNLFHEHARILQQLRAGKQLAPEDIQVAGALLPRPKPQHANMAPASEAFPKIKSTILEQAELVELVAVATAEIEEGADDTANVNIPTRKMVQLMSAEFESEVVSDQEMMESECLGTVAIPRCSMVAEKLEPREEWQVTPEMVNGTTNSIALADGGEVSARPRPSRTDFEQECVDLFNAIRSQGVKKISERHQSTRTSRRISDSSMRIILESERMMQIRECLCSCVGSLPLSPHCSQRLAWDLLSMAFVFYEVVTIPVLLLVLPSQERFSMAVDQLVNIYWSLDILLSFLTCVEVDGELDGKFRSIALRYAKTWLGIDLLMVLPEWVLYCQGSDAAGLSALRVLKITRVLRLLRLVKIENAIRKQLGRINSSSILNLLNLAQTVLGFAFLNHFIACVWFYLGQAEGNGWVTRREAHDNSDDVAEGYTLALHWAVAQFHGTAELFPSNIDERIFAVCTQVIGLLTLSIFVSTVTNVAMQERQARRKLYERRENLRVYFLRHKVSTELMLSVKSFLKAAAEEKDWIDDHEVLKGIPRLLQKSVLLEARSPIVENHPLFRWFVDRHKSAFSDMCYSAFSTSRHLDGTVIFEEGDAWEKLIFVEDGHVRYVEGFGGGTPTVGATRSRNNTKILPRSQSDLRGPLTTCVGTKIDKKKWICELSLWVEGWQSKGDLLSVSNSCTLCLHSSTLDKVLKKFPAARLEVVMYVNGFLQDMISTGLESSTLNDLWSPEEAG